MFFQTCDTFRILSYITTISITFGAKNDFIIVLSSFFLCFLSFKIQFLDEKLSFSKLVTSNDLLLDFSLWETFFSNMVLVFKNLRGKSNFSSSKEGILNSFLKIFGRFLWNSICCKYLSKFFGGFEVNWVINLGGKRELVDLSHVWGNVIRMIIDFWGK